QESSGKCAAVHRSIDAEFAAGSNTAAEPVGARALGYLQLPGLRIAPSGCPPPAVATIHSTFRAEEMRAETPGNYDDPSEAAQVSEEVRIPPLQPPFFYWKGSLFAGSRLDYSSCKASSRVLRTAGMATDNIASSVSASNTALRGLDMK